MKGQPASELRLACLSAPAQLRRMSIAIIVVLIILRQVQDLRIASICGVFLIILIRYLHLHKCLCVSPVSITDN